MCPISRLHVQVDWICKHWPTFRYYLADVCSGERTSLISATAMSFGLLVGGTSMKLSCKNGCTENSLECLRIDSEDATKARRLSKENQMVSLVLQERARAGQ